MCIHASSPDPRPAALVCLCQSTDFLGDMLALSPLPLCRVVGK